MTYVFTGVVEGGTFEVQVGASSRDIRLTESVDLRGEHVAEPLSPESSADRWLEHPVAGPRLLAAIGDGDFRGMPTDDASAEMMRAVPLVRLSRFPGFPVDEDWLATLAAEANAAG